MWSSVKTALPAAAKVAAFSVLGNGALLRRRLKAIRDAGVTSILNLHRVAEDDGSDYRPLSPDLFDDLLAFAKREFAIVTISDLGERASKPKLVLSFERWISRLHNDRRSDPPTARPPGQPKHHSKVR